MRLGAEIDGYEWELTVDGLVVEMRRSRFPRVEGGERQSLYDVAVGEWNGERIEIRRWAAGRGDGLRMGRVLPMLSEMVRLAVLG